MKRTDWRGAIVLMIVLANLLANVHPALAGRKFSPDDDGYYFHRVCRDGMELYVFEWNSDSDSLGYEEGHTGEFSSLIGVFLGRLNSDFTDQILDPYNVDNAHEIVRYLADVSMTRRNSERGRLNLDEIDSSNERSNVRLSDTEGMRYWGKAVVTWPEILDVGTPLILYNLSSKYGLEDILDTDTEDLPRVDDCYILPENKPAPAAPPAAAPAAQPVPSTPKITARITAERLNVREGPRTNAPIIAKIYLDEVYYAIARDAAGAWVQLRVPDVPEDSGWIAVKFAQLSAPIAQLPVFGAQSAATASPASAPAAEPAPAAKPAPAAEPASVQPTVPANPGTLVDGFEKWGTWRRGDETWGTFVQSADDVYSGNFAGRLDYDFPSGVDNNYVVFRQPKAIAGSPNALGIWVNGDGSTHFLNVWIQDAKGQLWQYSFGRINHTGWQQMVTPLGAPTAWPNQAIGASSTSEPVYPIKFYALVLDGYAEDRAFAGSVYVDQLEAYTD